MRAILEDCSSNSNGILDAMQRGSCAGVQRRSVHDDGVAFYSPVQIQMRAVARIENGIVFKHYDGGFDGVESVAAAREDGPARGKRALASGFASIDGFVRNVPRAAVNDQSRFHQNENRKATSICPPRAKIRVREKKRFNTTNTDNSKVTRRREW